MSLVSVGMLYWESPREGGHCPRRRAADGSQGRVFEETSGRKETRALSRNLVLRETSTLYLPLKRPHRGSVVAPALGETLAPLSFFYRIVLHTPSYM